MSTLAEKLKKPKSTHRVGGAVQAAVSVVGSVGTAMRHLCGVVVATGSWALDGSVGGSNCSWGGVWWAGWRTSALARHPWNALLLAAARVGAAHAWLNVSDQKWKRMSSFLYLTVVNGISLSIVVALWCLPWHHASCKVSFLNFNILLSSVG